jgi:peptidoglycan/LPS O-acetylase OafA/YrhL
MAHPATHKRRADFQGLRGLAVLAVIAFHFGVPGFGGGFAGVDIFFVLSGFFITRLLARDIAVHGRIRFGHFWLARAKRLLPNAILVLLATVLASAVLLPAYRFPAIATDVGYASLFLANMHFATSALDYFNIGAPPSPVLHFWSLAVEEQFYLALPLVLALIARLSRRPATMAAILSVLAALSFAASLWVIGDNQPAAFFYPHHRGWELLLGGIVGLVYDQRSTIPAAWRTGLAWGGFAVLVVSIWALNDVLIYPGLWALMPTLGTAALLLGLRSGPATAPLGRLLSLPLATLVGDMSYSLYLWHWPVAVILAALWPGQFLARALGLVVAVTLAAAAYHLVERPIHALPLSGMKPARLLAAAGAGLALVLTGAFGLANLPLTRSPQITQAIAAAQSDKGEISSNGCFLTYDEIVQPLCQAGDLSGTRRVVLFGDSHATQWYRPLSIAAQNQNWVMELRNKSSCPPADVTVWYKPLQSRYELCDQWRTAQLADLVADPPQLVVLASSSHYDNRLLDRASGRLARPDQDQTFWQDGFLRTVQMLKGAGIAVLEVRDTPKLYDNVLECLSAGDWNACGRPAGEALAGLASPKGDWPALDFTRELCSPHWCAAVKNGQIIYRDSEHLTYSFPAIFAPRFEAALLALH